VTVPNGDGDGAAQRRPCRAETDGTPTINGARFAVISMDPHQPELFRVLNASADRHYDLSFDGLPFDIVAQDGVPLDFFPGAPRRLRVRHAVIPPAGRLEFLIRGQIRPVAMSSLCYDAGPTGDADPAYVFGVLTTRSASPAPVELAHSSLPMLNTGYYLKPLPQPSVFRTVHFQEEHGRFYLDGSSYEPQAPINMIAHSGTVEAWDLENDTSEVHVFHIHQTHFVVQSVNGVREPVPHWIDTVDLPPEHLLSDGSARASHVKVIVDFRDPRIRGIFFYHCHILDHEDNGMMARIQVL
jgi:FtsP/CotA-like multicopper oxidase with cupredoxin domain